MIHLVLCDFITVSIVSDLVRYVAFIGWSSVLLSVKYVLMCAFTALVWACLSFVLAPSQRVQSRLTVACGS